MIKSSLVLLFALLPAAVALLASAPATDAELEQLRRQDRRQVHLVPLMLVAGDHAMHDMAGSGDSSWKSRLEAEGYAVTCTMQGLGMLPAVQELYCRHMQAQQE